MARPCKRRRICSMPSCGRFAPVTAEKHPVITMSLDEFEAVRLIDLEGLTQQECAARMNVARTTVQAIYNSARTKLAECMVNKKELRIEGGDYVLCNGDSRECVSCPKRQKKENGDENNE